MVWLGVKLPTLACPCLLIFIPSTSSIPLPHKSVHCLDHSNCSLINAQLYLLFLHRYWNSSVMHRFFFFLVCQQVLLKWFSDLKTLALQYIVDCFGHFQIYSKAVLFVCKYWQNFSHIDVCSTGISESTVNVLTSGHFYSGYTVATYLILGNTGGMFIKASNVRMLRVCVDFTGVQIHSRHTL